MSWEISYYSEREMKVIEQWPKGIRASYARITSQIKEHGPNLGMPYTKAMGDGLFEIRAKGSEGIGRSFFCTLIGKKVVILHSFIKKTQKTPKVELEKARTRMKEIQS
jgi:phage-related protein